MSELPPQVTNLHVVTLDHTDTLVSLILFDLFSSLPRGLVSFKSDKLESIGALVASFKLEQLPSLLHLTLPWCLKLTQSSIKCLPRTLKTLDVEVEGLSGNDDLRFLAHLPPHLEQCKVFPFGCTSNDIQEYWPPVLWRCFLVDRNTWHKIPRLRERLALDPPPPSSNFLTSIVDSIFK